VTRAALVRRFTFGAAAAVFVLLFAGALVTSTESGLAVPDWPLSYGKVMPPMVGGIRFEHGHRLVAAAVSTIVGLQIAVLLWGEKRKSVRRLGFLAFGAILLQALLGGLTVLLLLPPAVSTAHAALAEIVFALTAVVALQTSRLFVGDAALAPAPESLRPAAAAAFRAASVAAGVTYLQILLGAVMRHTGAGLAVADFPLVSGRLLPSLSLLGKPGVPIHLAHRLGAVAVLVAVAVAVRRLAALDGLHPVFAKLSAAWVALVTIQVMLGAMSIWSAKAPLVTAVHLATGALLWVTAVVACVLAAHAAKGTAAAEIAAPSPAPSALGATA